MKLGDFRQSDDVDKLRRLVARFNDNRTDYPRDLTVHAVFTRQARARPTAAAVFSGEREYSYRELEAAANRLARFLIEQGLRHEERVAILLERPFETAAAILGILKAGGAYVPIDEDDPFERIRFLIGHTDARILISERCYLRLLNRLQWECPGLDTLVCVDSRDIHREPEERGEFLKESLWEHVGLSAFDDISGGGWTSSYTGEFLSREVMDQYGDNVLTKLRSYLSEMTRVLEIGCASGITLFRLAPLVGFYYGTDLSRTILQRTEQEIARGALHNVRLRPYPAHETERVEEAGFDIVILNSVIECFPGHNYLRDVLRQAIDRMAGRGLMFLGNLWDAEKKDAFVRSLIEFRDANSGKGYRTKVDRSDDLFISRDFLEDLRHEFPQIREIDYSGMQGTAKSELSEYGFDAILHIDRGAVTPSARAPRKKRQYDLRTLEPYPDAPPPERAGPTSLAYVIYTSGTSGQPKGVMVEHRSIARLVLNTDYLQLGPEDRVLQTGSIAFDASTFEIFGPLLNGGALCRPPQRSILDPAEVTRLIARYRITAMFLTTSLFNQYVDRDINVFSGLKSLLIGGEKASCYHCNKVRERHPQLLLINGYGPTENTTFTTSHRIDRDYATDVPIGRPIANTEVLILDPEGALTPIGVAGEICAGGDGLARGYLNDPELTRQKFVPHPWDPVRRLYRTGDWGLWRADGTIDYRGRIDDQVKIRGFRIEPAEVEHHVLQEPSVKEVVVAARELGGSDVVLVAYLTTEGGGAVWDEQDLRERLKQTLPDYMVPAHIVRLDRMPLNANGKVDRKALPDPVLQCDTRDVHCEPPATETERSLLAIWEEVLGRSGLGVTDNFFDRGGHSLKITRVMARIEQCLGVTVPLTELFLRPTVRELANYILDGTSFGVAGIDEALVPLSADAPGPNLFAFPPGTGDALGFVQLASRLPCRFYGFNFIAAESWLQDYADLILRIDPDGPYLLFGYSSGGNLAYQVARELEDRGRRVAAILMIDSARQLAPMPLSAEEVERVTDEFLGDESMLPYLASPLLLEKARRQVRLSLSCVGRALDYPWIDADIHVLTAENSVSEYRDGEGTLTISLSAWAEATRGSFLVYPGVGHHNFMLAHPYLDRNAEVIRDILARITVAVF
jgi:amino acid adenylation domain-containing protein